ncbi:hypothetical protein ASF66_13350 [Pseudomonas sp. Leaf129]|nr:hypothetical protein ASF66_13350 [Pseudomonas sp. Leaf129]
MFTLIEVPTATNGARRIEPNDNVSPLITSAPAKLDFVHARDFCLNVIVPPFEYEAFELAIIEACQSIKLGNRQTCADT